MSSYYVGSHRFASRAAVKRYLGDELEARRHGDRIEDSRLIDVLTRLVSEHPRPSEKIGEGIEYWAVWENADLHHRTKGYRIK
ncbi:hypothetical protein GCM10027449_26290 [Sinomonas notoginsengisoli]|uniref:hypothetical protein n=1 Tax=Sinomonas notoginsengisoli TaxID=1457311 RepID=UPI001F450B1B|nr:hypothetical protein [Sinomonas notoginsengisoli]